MAQGFKSVIGFAALILVGIAGVAVSEVLRLGDVNSLIMTIDNVAHVR